MSLTSRQCLPCKQRPGLLDVPAAWTQTDSHANINMTIPDQQCDFCVPEAKWFADLQGIQTDLSDCLSLCDSLENLKARFLADYAAGQREGWGDALVLDSIWYAAIIRLIRCTTATGVREPVRRSWIDEMSPQLRDSLDYFKAMRDKFIAHSVNEFERNEVFVNLRRDGGGSLVPYEIMGRAMRISQYYIEDLPRLRELANYLIERVRHDKPLEMKRLVDVAKSMPVEDIIARGPSSDCDPMPRSGVAKGRKPFM